MSICNSDAVIPAPKTQDDKISPWYFRKGSKIAGLAPGRSHCSLVILDEEDSSKVTWEQSCNSKAKVKDFIESALIDQEWEYTSAECIESDCLAILEERLRSLYNPV